MDNTPINQANKQNIIKSTKSVENLVGSGEIKNQSKGIDLVKLNSGQAEIKKLGEKVAILQEWQDDFVSFREKWHEVTEIQKSMQDAKQEIATTQQKMQTWENMLEGLNDKKLQQQQTYLKQHAGFEQLPGNIQ